MLKSDWRNRKPIIDEARYAVSTFGKTLIWTTAEIYTLYSMTETFGIGAAHAGVLYVVLLIWSGVCDAFAGALATKLSFPQRIAVTNRVCVLASGGLFYLGLSGLGGVIISIACVFAFRSAFSICDVLHNTQIVALGSTAKSKSRLAATRFAAATLASLSVGVGIAWERATLSGTSLAAVFGGIAACGTLLFLCAPRLKTRLLNPGLKSTPIVSVLRAVVVPPFVLAVAAAATGSLVISLLLKALPFIAERDYANAAWAGAALIALNTGRLASILAWRWLFLSLSGVTASAVSFTLASVIALASAYLPTGDGVGQLVMLGVALAGISIGSWILLPDLSATLRNRSGVWLDPVVMGTFAFLMKAANGMSALMLLVLLDFAPNSPGPLLAEILFILSLGTGFAALGFWFTRWRFRDDQTSS